jgi:hypothetical protein
MGGVPYNTALCMGREANEEGKAEMEREVHERKAEMT